MNLMLSKSEFNDLLVLYIIEMAKDFEKLQPGEEAEDDITASFLKHITSVSMGNLRTERNHADAKIKLFLQRLKTKMESENVAMRIIG